MNPYKSIEDHQFWKRGVRAVEFFDLDPLPNAKFRIGRGDKVVTAGSCFAQHLARALQGAGFDYLVTEAGEALSAEARARRQYGLFSARFGNIYTVAHLRQLLEEAFGMRQAPQVAVPRASDGRLVDLLRPSVEPDGFDSAEAVHEARQIMLEAVRRMVTEGDVFVFTMGLTEGWRSRVDGTVFPVAPGVIGGAFDPKIHEFVNYTAAEVQADLDAALEIIWSHRPQMRVVLTVSPVPLIATYEAQHVLVSTTYSKSVLRVVAEDTQRKDGRVLYFPSYEVVTGHYNQGRYFEDDLREVSPIGVAHVMRIVMSSLVEPLAEGASQAARELGADAEAADIVCDEEAIAQIL